LEAPPVTVEVICANGLPSFTLVGLADVEVKEARERVRCAIQNAGLEFPHNKRITVNLAPADLPKDSGRLDLPIAMGILAASGQIDAASSGGLRVRGRAVAQRRPASGARRVGYGTGAARRRGAHRALVLPPGGAEEAALVPGRGMYRAAHLLDVGAPVSARRGHRRARPMTTAGGRACTRSPCAAGPAAPTWRDVKGQAGAKRALEIAAAGGTACCWSVRRVRASPCWPSALPACYRDMDTEQALAERAPSAAWAGAFRWSAGASARPAARTIPPAQWRLVGAARRRGPEKFPWPTTACCFWTSSRNSPAARWRPCAEPLETGTITIARAARRAEFPARFQFGRRR
jgi:magnesium chelatase family protein